MIPSSLRYTQRHLRRVETRCFLPSSNNSVRSSRFIFHHDNTTRFIAGISTNYSSIINNLSKRRNYNAISGSTIQQFRNLSEKPTDPTPRSLPRFLIHKNEDLPDLYYFPLSLLREERSKFSEQAESSLELNSLTINNVNWYTAAYDTDQIPILRFGMASSGTFGELLQKYNPTLANEEVMNINGTNYYKTKEVAMEAAAARVIDLYAESNKKEFKQFREDDSVMALRYCVEDPGIVVGDVISIASRMEKFSRRLHTPRIFIENYFDRVKGLSVKDCYHSQDRVYKHGEHEGLWSTATFTDPITSEVFHSGLVGKMKWEKREGEKLSLDEALVRIEDGKVYYQNARLARHAAAARAIDCYAFREGDDEVAKKYQLCLEEPYSENAMGSDDYDKLLERKRMQQTTTAATTPSTRPDEKPVSFNASLKNYAFQLHNPMDFLAGSFRRVHGFMYKDSAFQDETMELEGKTWHTSSFCDETSNEIFQAGLVKPLTTVKRKLDSVAAVPPCEDEVRVKDGKVYYSSTRNARHAAAARAIDCYLHREGTENFREKYQLCYEEPYFEGDDSYQFDYSFKFLRQREIDIDEMPDMNQSFTKKTGEKTFKSVAASFSFQLHAPVNFLENSYRQIYGSAYPKESFQYQTVRPNDNTQKWFTATFTDPGTSEVFASGLVAPIHIPPKKGVSLRPPLGEAEVHIMDGKVYYTEERFARHAAAARAIDNYLHREGSDRLTNECKLCLEEPYNDAAERDSTHNDYDELLRQRKATTGITFGEHNTWKRQISGKSLTSELAVNPWKLHIPMQLLKNVKFGESGAKNVEWGDYSFESVILDGRQWHTAEFIDPNTSEVFRAGIGRHVDAKKKQGAFLSPSLDEAENRVANGKVYYHDQKVAKHAAAARAIDCYLYRDSGDFSTNQLCLEDPYKEGDAQEIDYDALAETRTNTLVVGSPPKSPRSQPEQEPTSKMPFKSIAQSNTHLLHVPVNFLERCFRQMHGYMYPNESFQYESAVTANGRQWFTSTFTNPSTSEVFASGLVRPIDVEKKKGATLSSPLGEAEVHIMDGKVYYAEEKFARHAAAARAIDNFMHREGSDRLVKKYQLCLEEPYNDAAERDSTHNDYDELLRRRSTAAGKESSAKTSEEDNTWKLHVPLTFLKSYLSERFGVELFGVELSESLGQESVEIGTRLWHTATFTDPITSEVFRSGLVGPINAYQKERRKGRRAVLSPTLNEAEVRILDGKVYYPKFLHAKHAAAARAIDCYFYRDRKANGEVSKYQLCLEDPYEAGAMKEVDYGVLVASRENAKSLDSVEDMMPYLDEDSVASRDKTKSLDSVEDSWWQEVAEDTVMPYLDESDEDFTIVSRTYSDQPTRVDQKLSTLGRIAEIWAETPANSSASKLTRAKIASSTKGPRDSTGNIINWFKRVDHTPSNIEQALAFSQLCNKTLLALAKENAEKVIHSNTSNAECAEIQKEAKSILDKLMSISSQFASTDESLVNTETLNAYIQCLSRVDVEESAAVAEGLLKRMSEGEDNLPPPNIGTYNAVMKLWSLADGEKGKDGVNDTFSLLQNAAIAREDLCPDRDAFQILLAANSKENNHFKYELALAALERTKALSQDLCGEAFIPEADDYNAALKNTATNCLANGDYQPPWFWHGQQYDGGFKAMDDDKKCEALDMEKWLQYAEEMGVSPSEDMYFQVIKAWASTGSLEGLIGGDGALGAEELAKKAVLQSEGAPNMKMFYPIIAAWSLCGEKLGPDRVKEWIDQIFLLGMKPDLDLQVAYFVAAEKWQSKLVTNLLGNNVGLDGSIVEENAEGASSDGDIESLFKAAQYCSRHLKEMSSDENRQDIADLDAFTSMLRYSIKAWSRASDSTLLLPDGSTSLDTTQGVEEMAKVLKCISLTNHSQDSADVDEALVNAAGKVYTEFTSQIRKLDSTMNGHLENNEKCYFADRVADVESSLRSYEFHSRRLASNEKLLPESNDIRHNLYRETLRGCAGVKSSTDYGHMMRICTLIMDCLSWHHGQTRDHGSSKEAEDVTDMYSDIAMISSTCVKNPYERMNVLRSIYDRASDFFPKKNPHHESNYARVDRAALLGSMRRSLGDSEMTDSFLSSFEEGKQGQRRRSRQRGR